MPLAGLHPLVEIVGDDGFVLSWVLRFVVPDLAQIEPAAQHVLDGVAGEDATLTVGVVWDVFKVVERQPLISRPTL